MAAIEEAIVTASTKSRLLDLGAKREACEGSLWERGDHSPGPALLQLGEARKQKTRVGETRVSLVAGERNHLYRTWVSEPP